MSANHFFPEGKIQKYSQRRRTTFTQKQVETLKHFFEENPYPNPKKRQEIASQMNVDPTVVQIWFKNQRAKCKRVNCNIHQKQVHQQSPQVQEEHQQLLQQSPQCQQSPQLQYHQILHGRVNTSPSQSEETTPPSCPTSVFPVAQIYTNHQIPSFQLSVYPDFKESKYLPEGHKMVHFGCCQDPAIYLLQPILKTQIPSRASHSLILPLNPQKEKKRQLLTRF
nr:divergent paired-related homeobox [Meriones unguiculatus]